MVTSKSVEKNNEEWYNKTVQIFERSYRTDASFVISHIKSAQKKFTCQGYLITAAKGKPLKVFSGESEAVEKQLQNSKMPYSQLITVQNNRSLQNAYIAYTKDKQKLTEALNNSGFTAIEDVDSFMSDYDKVMIRVAENISQRHLFDSIGLWYGGDNIVTIPCERSPPDLVCLTKKSPPLTSTL